MPLNEASRIPRSSLTTKQQQEALRAVFGVAPEPTPLEIDELRERLAQAPAKGIYDPE